MIPFKDTVKIIRDLTVVVVLITAFVIWKTGIWWEREPLIGTDSFVPVIVDIPPPPPTVVEFHSDGDARVEIDTVNINPVFEHHDHHVLVKETVIIQPPAPVKMERPMPEPIKQSPLIQHRDVRVVKEGNTHVHYGFGYSTVRFHSRRSGPSNWDSQNDRTAPWCTTDYSFNTQGCP